MGSTAMTSIGWRAGSGQPKAAHPWAVLAVALLASLAHARGVRPVNGLVSIADGGTFTVIRGDDLRTGTKGVTLAVGDIVETAPAAFLVVQMQGGTLIGIGPSTEVYLTERGGLLSLLLLKGWLKADARASGAVRVSGPRLGVESHQAVVVLHAEEGLDALFDEQGSAALLERMPEIGKQTRPSEFLSMGEDRDHVLMQGRPSADFLAQMPIAFRDALPRMPEEPARKPLQPQWVRKVSYLDIQPWLTAQVSWRAGFIRRFRGRLKDPAFFSAMDAHLREYPEWAPVLHPPQPDEPDNARP